MSTTSTDDPCAGNSTNRRPSGAQTAVMVAPSRWNTDAHTPGSSVRRRSCGPPTLWDPSRVDAPQHTLAGHEHPRRRRFSWATPSHMRSSDWMGPPTLRYQDWMEPPTLRHQGNMDDWMGHPDSGTKETWMAPGPLSSPAACLTSRLDSIHDTLR